MNSYSSMWTYLPIFLPQDFLRDNLIGTILTSLAETLDMNGRAHYGVDTSRESEKAGGVSSNHSPSTISPRYRAIFSTTISSFCRPLVRCGRSSSWNSSKSWSLLLSPSHFPPILRGHRLRSFCIEFILSSNHPTGVSCYGVDYPLHLYWSLAMEQEYIQS